MAITITSVPQNLLDALDAGELLQAQLRQLIVLQAEAVGISFDDAVARAQADTLPRDPIGADLRLLVRMLRDDADATLNAHA